MTTTAIFTPREYRCFGHQLAGFHPHCTGLNTLLSMAYPEKHSIRKACFSAVEDGLFAFRCRLEILSRQEHPGIDLHYAFHPNGQEDYHQPPNLPGCTETETEQLAESAQRCRLKKKREPLTAHEVAIVVRCYRHINETISAILTRVEATGNVLPALCGLSLSTQLIRNALTELQKEEQRVAYEQA